MKGTRTVFWYITILFFQTGNLITYLLSSMMRALFFVLKRTTGSDADMARVLANRSERDIVRRSGSNLYGIIYTGEGNRAGDCSTEELVVRKGQSSCVLCAGWGSTTTNQHQVELMAASGGYSGNRG